MRTIVKRPLVTEKTVNSAKKRTYTFEVDMKANKIEVASAIEKQFNVHVTSVRTAIMHGKSHRVGKKREEIKRSDWKKAFIQVKEGENIPVFETQS